MSANNTDTDRAVASEIRTNVITNIIIIVTKTNIAIIMVIIDAGLLWTRPRRLSTRPSIAFVTRPCPCVAEMTPNQGTNHSDNIEFSKSLLKFVFIRFKTNSRLSFRDEEPERNHHHLRRDERHGRPRDRDDDMSPDVFEDRSRSRSRNRGQTSRSGSNESLRSMLRRSARDMIDESKEKHQRSKSNASLKRTSTQLFEAKYPAVAKAPVEREHEEPKGFKKWIKKTMRGGFFFNPKQEGLVSNSYALELHTSSSVYFTIETYKTPLSTSNLK
jgi:hypothetical protein